MTMDCECAAAGEKNFLEGLVVELLASRGEPPPPLPVPQSMAGLFETLKARVTAAGGGGGGGGEGGRRSSPQNYELNRELVSANKWPSARPPSVKVTSFVCDDKYRGRQNCGPQVW